MHQSLFARQKPLTVVEEQDLSARRDAGEIAARDEMVLRNMALVPSTAKPFIVNHRHYEPEILSAATEGLIRAADLFNPTLGWRFSTYACKTIRRRCTQWERQELPLIRVPAYHYDRSYWQTAENPGNEYQTQANKIRGLAISYGDTETVMLAAPEPPANREDFRPLAEGMKTLNPQQRDILCRRFGIGYLEPQTLDEVGKYYGFTPERARQIQRIAKKKLQRYFDRNQIQYQG